jgi:hypothetical protein
MEAEPNDAYEHCEETKPRYEPAAVGLRSLEGEVIRDDRPDLSGRHAGRTKRRNGVHVRP